MTNRARRMAEVTRLPMRDRRASRAERAIVAGGIAIPTRGDASVVVDGHKLALTSLDRVIYPEAGFTKADVVAYYLSVATSLLPHLAARPLTVGRFPGGVDGRGFAQTEIPGRPEWVESVSIDLVNGKTSRFTVATERATLVWLAQMGVVELHTFLGRWPELDRPAAVLFDLDPTPPAGLPEAARVALALRDLLPVRSWAKTSGSAGIHVLVPTEGSYEASRAFASGVARMLEERMPDLVTTRMRKADRAGKVLVDTRQNSERLTVAAPYSLRSTPLPMVSTPVAWDEVEANRLVFQAHEIAERLSTLGDPMSDLA